MEIEERNLGNTLLLSLAWMILSVLYFIGEDKDVYRSLYMFVFMFHFLVIVQLALGIYIRVNEKTLYIRQMMRLPKRIPMDTVQELRLEQGRFHKKLLIHCFDKTYKIYNRYEESLEVIKEQIEGYLQKGETNGEIRS